jgi:hypothetical protein
MKHNLNVGDKAKAIKSWVHNFEDGEVIYFSQYRESDGLYLFENEEGHAQFLTELEFELV